MNEAQRRLSVVSGHFFQVVQNKDASRAAGQPAFDVRELQRLLEHDNHEHRAQMKEFMKQDIYIP
jgi:acyl-CoA oxidase